MPDHKNDIWWLEGTGSFCSLLKKGDKVLDVGCGSGLKSKYLYSKGFDVTGIDLSDKLIDIARRESPRYRICRHGHEGCRQTQSFIRRNICASVASAHT